VGTQLLAFGKNTFYGKLLTSTFVYASLAKRAPKKGLKGGAGEGIRAPIY
jgi:hypothetical protein